MPLFQVPLAEPGRLTLLPARQLPDESTERVLGKFKSISLARYVNVSARNKTEAAKVAEAENPGFYAVRRGIKRVEG